MKSKWNPRKLYSYAANATPPGTTNRCTMLRKCQFYSEPIYIYYDYVHIHTYIWIKSSIYHPIIDIMPLLCNPQCVYQKFTIGPACPYFKVIFNIGLWLLISMDFRSQFWTHQIVDLSAFKPNYCYSKAVAMCNSSMELNINFKIDLIFDSTRSLVITNTPT